VDQDLRGRTTKRGLGKKKKKKNRKGKKDGEEQIVFSFFNLFGLRPWLTGGSSVGKGRTKEGRTKVSGHKDVIFMDRDLFGRRVTVLGSENQMRLELRYKGNPEKRGRKSESVREQSLVRGKMYSEGAVTTPTPWEAVGEKAKKGGARGGEKKKEEKRP